MTFAWIGQLIAVVVLLWMINRGANSARARSPRVPARANRDVALGVLSGALFGVGSILYLLWYGMAALAVIWIMSRL